jgi:hypothetical protein
MQGDNGQMTLEEQIALLDKCRWILEGADKSNDDELTKISMLDELDDVLAKLQAIAVGKLADEIRMLQLESRYRRQRWTSTRH